MIMSIVLVLMLFLSLFVCCSDEGVSETPKLELEQPDPVETPQPDTGWIYDESGYFAYYEYEMDTKADIRIYLEPDVGCPENVTIYETGLEQEKRYGYMDLNFNKLSGAVNYLPSPFENGICSIFKEDGTSYFVDTNFNKLENQIYNMILDGNNIYYYGYTVNGLPEFQILSDVDPDEFLVPVFFDSDPATGKPYDYRRTGFKTLAAYYDKSIDENEGLTLEAEYISAGIFKDGLCSVVKPTSEGRFRTGYIDTKGNLAIDYIYDGGSYFYEGYATVYIKEDNESTDLEPGSYVIDTENNIIAGPFRMCDNFRNGFCKVYISEKFMGNFINTEGELLNDEEYILMEDFFDGIALVSTVNSTGFIDTEGNHIEKMNLREARRFSDGLAAVMNQDQYWGYIDTDGNWVIEPRYRYAGSFYNGFALVRERHGQSGYLRDKEGNKYLEELNLIEFTRFNDDGYALAKSEYIEDGDMKTKYYLIQLLP